MRYVVTDKDAIPEWLYPGTWPECLTPSEHEIDIGRELDLNDLWGVLSPDRPKESVFQRQSFEDCGIPHDAPDHVKRVCEELISRILAVPVHERWKIAKKWAGNPNEETLSVVKRKFNKLCELASIAKQDSKFIVLLPEEY